MRFRLNRPWPVSQFVLPAGMICDRTSSNYLERLGASFIPPPDTIPLDAGATNLLAAVYTPTGYTREDCWSVNINNF